MRTAEIDAGARRSRVELLDWFGRSAEALDAAMDGLPADRWHAEVVTAQGRAVPAAEVPWLRAREVMVHAVDLRTGLAFADLPADFAAALVDDIVAKRGRTGDGPALSVRPTDHRARWSVPGAGQATTVTGPLAGLAAYLAGRGTTGVRTGGGPLPELPPWL